MQLFKTNKRKKNIECRTVCIGSWTSSQKTRTFFRCFVLRRDLLVPQVWIGRLQRRNNKDFKWYVPDLTVEWILVCLMYAFTLPFRCLMLRSSAKYNIEESIVILFGSCCSSSCIINRASESICYTSCLIILVESGWGHMRSKDFFAKRVSLLRSHE